MIALLCHYFFQVIQLQGDHRQDVFNFLQKEGIAKREKIKLHGAHSRSFRFNSVLVFQPAQE